MLCRAKSSLVSIHSHLSEDRVLTSHVTSYMYITCIVLYNILDNLTTGLHEVYTIYSSCDAIDLQAALKKIAS